MKKHVFIFFSVFILSSCGYKTYDECHKSEMQKNNGVDHSSIRNYCRDLFPRKLSTPKQIEDKDLITLIEGEDYSLNYYKHDRWVTITNTTRDKNIRSIRSYGFHAENCNDSTKTPVVKPESLDPRLVNLKPGKEDKYILKADGENCLYIWVKGK